MMTADKWVPDPQKNNEVIRKIPRFRLDFLARKSVHAERDAIVETSVTYAFRPGPVPGLRWWKRQPGTHTEVRMRATWQQSPGQQTTAAAQKGPISSTRDEKLSKQIATLNELTAQQLRDEWRRLYRGQPPRLSRDLLIRTLAYRVQELVYGGLSKAAQRKLAALTEEFAASNSIVVAHDLRLRPGARLVREWRGRTHTVIVSDDGYEYAGKSYSSLTTIAKVITGAHWSGPRFFGLNGSATAQVGEDAHE